METKDEFDQEKKIDLVTAKSFIKTEVKREKDFISLWGTTQKIGTVKGELPPQDRLPRDVIDAIEEIFTVQIEFIANMKQMQLMISTIRDHVAATGGSNKKNQLETLNNYLTNLNELFSLYEESLAYPLFINADGSGPSPEEVIKKLSETFQSEPLKKFLQQTGKLTDDIKVINQIEVENDPLLSGNPEYQKAIVHYATPEEPNPPVKKIGVYTIMPMQNMTRIQLLTKALGKELDSFERKPHSYHTDQLTPEGKNSVLLDLKQLTQAAISSADEQATIYNAKVGAVDIAKSQFTSLEAKMKPEEKQAAMLRKILAMNMNTSLQEKSHASKAFPDYLKTALPLMYDKSFELDAKGGIRITVPISDPTYRDIHFALGISMTNTKAVILDPSKFDAKYLDALYSATQNPLWIVLKSTKPIDATFTASQKMQAYIDVAQAFHDKRIGDVDKYKGAYNVALTAVQIAREHPDADAKKAVSAAFEPNGNSKAPNIGQWIVDKTQTKAQSTVRKDLTVTVRPPSADATPSETPIFIESAQGTPAAGSVIETVSPGDELSDAGSDKDPDEVSREFEASLVEERTAELKQLRGQGSVTSAKALKAAERDNAQLRSQLEETTQQLAALTDKLRVVEDQNSVLTTDIKQIDVLKGELEQLKVQASTAQSALLAAEQALLAKGAEVANARTITGQHAGALDSAHLATQTEKARADRLDSELAAERAGLTKAQSTLESIQGERTQLLQEIQAERAKASDLSGRLRTAEASLLRMEESLQSLQTENGQLREAVQREQHAVTEEKSTVKRLTDELTSAKGNLATTQRALDESRSQLQSLEAGKTEVATVTRELSEVRKQTEQLTQQLEQEQAKVQRLVTQHAEALERAHAEAGTERARADQSAEETRAANDQIRDLQTQLATAQRSVEALSLVQEENRQLKSAQAVGTVAAGKLGDLQAQVAQLTEQLRVARAETSEAADRLAELQAAPSGVVEPPEPVLPSAAVHELEEMRRQVAQLKEELLEARSGTKDVVQESATAQAVVASSEPAPAAVVANSSVSATVSPADAAESERLRKVIGSRLQSVAASLTSTDFNMLLSKV